MLHKQSHGLGLAFFGLLALLALFNWLSAGNILALPLAVYNVLLASLLVMRSKPRRPATTSGLALGIAGSLLPFILVIEPAPESASNVGLAVQMLALIWMIASADQLGKSFGIAPADRGLVTHGLYQIVRHPLYLGELVFYAGVFIAHPTVLHLALWASLACVQVVRLLAEERTIEGYAQYAQAVRWQLAPGIW